MAKKERYYPRNKGPKGLSQRYVRKRYEEPPESGIIQRSKHFEYVEADIECDECWDPRNYSPAFDYDRHYYYYGEYDHDTGHYYRHNIFLDEIIKSFGPPFGEIKKKTNRPETLPERLPEAKSDEQLPIGKIEARLYRYIVELCRLSFDNSERTLKKIRKAMGSNRRTLEIVNRAGKLYGNKAFAKVVCLFSPFWARSPHTWDPAGETSLLRHLFVKYDAPEFLEKEWVRNAESHSFKWLSWFVILGQGGSLKSAAKHFGWRIHSRFSFFLAEAPSNVNPVTACIYAEIMRLGGSEKDVRRILANAAYIIDPTEGNIPATYDVYPVFWESTVRWLVRHSDEITDDDSQLILNWAMHEYTESMRGGGELFSWKGRSLRRVLELSHEYWRRIAEPWAHLKWNRRGWDWEIEENQFLKWSFVELTSGEELYHEGRQLHHCVSSYAGRCAAGRSAIVSLRRNDARCVTIEIAPSSMQIVQVRGIQNRNASGEERTIISKWMETVVLK